VTTPSEPALEPEMPGGSRRVPTLSRIALTPAEAAEAIGCSAEFFREKSTSS
jgi:hypothetical protein